MPDLATLAPLFILLAVLVTALKAFLELLIVPFLPYEVEALTAFIPALTALLNLLFALLVNFGDLTPTIGASKSAIADKASLAPTPKSVNPCSNLMRSILPRSSAASRSACPCGEARIAEANRAPRQNSLAGAHRLLRALYIGKQGRETHNRKPWPAKSFSGCSILRPQ